jgi:AraC-like DNA-binding protein
MKTGPRPLFVMHRSDQLKAQVRRLAGRDFTCRFIPDWVKLVAAVREAPPSAIASADPYEDPEGRRPSRSLLSLVAEFPSLPVFVAADFSSAREERVAALEGYGLAGVITIGVDDTPEVLRERFRRVEGRFMKLLLARVLPAGMPGRAGAILDVAAEVVSTGGVGRDMARALSTSRRSLLRWMYSSELLSPRKMLLWMRLLQAAELLDDPGCSVLSVARACGYSSDSGLRRVTTKLLGKCPTELRRHGAFAEASRVFLAALEHPRARQRLRLAPEVPGSEAPCPGACSPATPFLAIRPMHAQA